MARAGIGETGPERPRGLARIKAWARNSPWWAISIGLHLIVFLAATLVYIEKYMILGDAEFSVEMNRAIDPISELQQMPEEKAKPPEDESKPQEEKPQELAQDAAQDEPSAGNEFEGDTFGSDSASSNAPSIMGMASIGGTGRPVGGGPRRRATRKPQKIVPGPGEEEIRAALRWLARHQGPDGSWSVTRFSKNCGRFGYRETCADNAFEGNPQYDVGVTGLALLSFLGAGHTTADREPVFPESGGPGDLGEALGEERTRPLSYGEVAKRAIRFLIRAQGASGLIGPEVDRAIYNHTIAALALAEAHRETGVAALIEPVEKALRYLAAARTAKGGWRYSAQLAQTDASVTGWAVLALHAAELAGIAADREAQDDLRRWFDRATIKASIDPRILKGVSLARTGHMLLTGYQGPKDAGKLVAVNGMNDGYGYTPALTATMVMATVILDGKPSSKAEGAVETLLAFLPPRFSPADRDTWKVADFYYWFHATYALSQLAGNGDERWKRWCAALSAALLDTQNLNLAKGTCREGSWEPVDRWSCEGGRVYATAMAALTLEARFGSPRLLARARPPRPILLEVR